MDGELCDRLARAATAENVMVDGLPPGSVMLCHREDRDNACAGFLLSDDARDHFALRFARVTGMLEWGLPTCNDELHPTIDDMRRAHGLLE